MLEEWWSDIYSPGATGEGGIYAGKSYWICTYDWSTDPVYPTPITYPYDANLYQYALTCGYSTGDTPVFAIIGYDGSNKIIYWDSSKYEDGDLIDTDDFRTALNKAINEFPHEGLYLNEAVPTKVYDIGFFEDIDVSNVFGEYDLNPVTVTLEENSDPSAVTASLDGNTLSLNALAHSDSYTTITLKGTSGDNSLTSSFDVYTYEPTSFKILNQDFEADVFPPPFWEVKYNTAADGGINGENLIDPPTADTWYKNTTSDPDFVHINSGESSAIIAYWAEDFNWLISPEMQLDFNDYVLKFWMWFESSVYESKLHILVDDGTKGWTSIATYDGTSPDNYFDSEIELDLSAYYNQTVRIAFVNEYTYGMEIALDDISITSTTDISETSLPSGVTLSQNYPNPFNPSTEIKFSIPQESIVNLSVFNSKGEMVKELLNGSRDKGSYQINFNAENLNSGIYYYRLNVNGISTSKKMLLIK